MKQQNSRIRGLTRSAAVGLASVVATVGCSFATLVAIAQPVALAPQAKPAKPANPGLGEQWIRIERDPQGDPLAMQTAVVRYVQKGTPGAKLVTVDLIGAVHVGDPAYYAKLNRRFRNYEALLYELVAPEGTVVPRGAKVDNRGALGMIQGGMGAALELVHQVEYVDYTRPNFVHADMSPEEFFQTMEDRGESVVQLMLQAVLQGQKLQNQEGGEEKLARQNADLIVALFSKDRARRMKIVIARQFEDSMEMLSSFGGEQGTTIIHQRNKRALDVLRKEIDAGKTKLGVFYGAGHLDDMHKQLVADFGFEAKSIEWVNAWDLRAKPQ